MSIPAPAIDTLHLKGLRYQLSQHFIFNVLTSIRALLRKDAGQSVQALNSFAEYMRYALHKVEHFQVSLQEELEGLHHFIDLQQMRFANKINLELSADEQSLQYMLPAFVLQPVIEQGLKMAMTRNRSEVLLILRLQKQDGALVISVEAEGTLQKEGDKSLFTPPSDVELGILEAEQLLRSLYGETCRFEQREEQGKVINTFSIYSLK